MQLDIRTISSIFINNGVFDNNHGIVIKNGNTLEVIQKNEFQNKQNLKVKRLHPLVILNTIHTHLKQHSSKEFNKELNKDLFLIANHFVHRCENNKKQKEIFKIFKIIILKTKNWFCGYGFTTSFDVANEIISLLKVKVFRDVEKSFSVDEFENFAQVINKKDSQALSNLLTITPKSNAANLIKAYLNFIAKNHSADDDRIDFLLDQIKAKYDLDFFPYFSRKCGGITLNPDGIKIIIDYLINKGKLSEDKIKLCYDHAQFAQELQKMDWKKPSNKSYIVRNANEEWKNWEHVTHVHIEIEEAGISHIFITDTLGPKLYKYRDKKVTFNELILQIIQKEAPQNSTSFIYFYPLFRQTNHTSCPIFALHDAVRIFRDLKILDFIKNQKQSTDSAIFEFQILPPDMMVPHQYGINKLNQYSYIDHIITSSSRNKFQTLKEKINTNIRRSEIEGKLRDENIYSRKKEISYLGVILNKLLLLS